MAKGNETTNGQYIEKTFVCYKKKLAFHLQTKEFNCNYFLANLIYKTGFTEITFVFRFSFARKKKHFNLRNKE